MQNLIESKIFFAGFIIGMILFAGLIILNQSTSEYYVHQQGFPFPFYEWTFDSKTSKVGSLTVYDTVKVGGIVWLGLFADILVALISSLMLGIICKIIWSKTASKRSNYFS